MKFTATQTSSLLDLLAKNFPDSSINTLKGWLKQGRILVDGIVETHPKKIVVAGESVQVGERKKFATEGVKILYEDQHLVVIEKPEGLLSVSTAFEKKRTAHGVMKFHYRPKLVHVVHRLDQETSGVMVFALSEEAKEGLKKLFKSHDITRKYYAIVEGKPEASSGTWETYLYEDKAYNVHITEDPTRGQLATTHYAIKAIHHRYALLELQLETGKKNQIRVHCKHFGHPIVGDKKYGGKTNPLKRLGLHAHHLGFVHPITNKKLEFNSPLPPVFQKLVRLED
jgi:tRNA pseudouridine32 synthase/23S rRNA pseudouridine746 synthase/23S rRNA pseudouridine1911/1915/1917 synthase